MIQSAHSARRHRSTPASHTELCLLSAPKARTPPPRTARWRYPPVLPGPEPLPGTRGVDPSFATSLRPPQVVPEKPASGLLRRFPHLLAVRRRQEQLLGRLNERWARPQAAEVTTPIPPNSPHHRRHGCRPAATPYGRTRGRTCAAAGKFVHHLPSTSPRPIKVPPGHVHPHLKSSATTRHLLHPIRAGDRSYHFIRQDLCGQPGSPEPKSSRSCRYH